MKRCNFTFCMAVLVFAGTTTASAAPSRPTARLAPLVPDQWRRAGVGGTGCFWSLRSGGPVRMAMADGKAVVSINGRVVVLSPGRGARDLFPFTFDRWRSSSRDLTIAVANVGSSRSESAELLTSRSTLTLVRSGRRTVLHGNMACGS